MDDETPSTRHLVLKAKDVIPIDTLARPGDGSAISVQLIHRQNQLAEERASRRKERDEPFAAVAPPEPALSDLFKPREITPMDPPAPPGDQEAITVPDLLLENRVADEKAGWGRILHRKRRPSKRTRDFFLVVGTFDLAVVLLTRSAMNPMSFVYGIAAVTLLSSTAAWIMFVVMDDY